MTVNEFYEIIVVFTESLLECTNVNHVIMTANMCRSSLLLLLEYLYIRKQHWRYHLVNFTR